MVPLHCKQHVTGTHYSEKSIIVCTKTITGTENSMYFNNQRSESSCNSFLKLPRPHFKH